MKPTFLKKHHSAFLHILVFAIAIFVSLVIGEVAARVFHLSKTHTSYPWYVCKGSHTGYCPEKNSYGWRDHEFTKNKKINTFRIVCIGDSVTEGYMVELENIFPKILENKFRGTNHDVEVMNLGKAGNATPENLSTVKAIMDFSPDLIVYQFGLNDVEGFEHRERISPEDIITMDNITTNKEVFNPKVLLRKSVLYLALAERYNYFKLKAGGKHWAFNEWHVKDVMWKKEFVKLKEVLSEIQNHSKILIVYMPYDFQIYSSREEAFAPSQKLNEFCQDNNYYFLDFTRIFKNQKNQYNIFLDDCHLSDYGHRVVAEYLWDFISCKIMG